MKENVEEAIDRLEYVNRAYDCNNYYSRYDLDCIQILLSDYKRVLKENEKLKNQEATARKINELLVERYSNSIQVQKVKDKIEELKSNPLKIKQNDKYYYETHAYNEIIISVLQELIEESEK